jgi:hypothetical protein
VGTDAGSRLERIDGKKELEMETFLAVCAGLFILTVGVVAVFLIQTLIQVKKTARSVEILTTNVNQEVMHIQNLSNTAMNVANMFTGSMGRTVSLAVSLINGFLKKKNKPSSGLNNKESHHNVSA